MAIDPSAAFVAPQRLLMVRLSDPRTRFLAQFNPTEFEEMLSVQYVRQAPVGLPHRVLQYTGTENHQLRFELFFHGNFDGVPGPSVVAEGFRPKPAPITFNRTIESIHDARRFLLSLCYPTAIGEGVLAAPPRVLVIWPNVVSMNCVVTRITFRHEQFELRGATRQLRAQLEIEEIRDFRLLSEDVDLDGTRRSSGSPEVE